MSRGYGSVDRLVNKARCVQCNATSEFPVRSYEVKAQPGNVVTPKLPPHQFVCHKCMNSDVYKPLVIDTYVVATPVLPLLEAATT